MNISCFRRAAFLHFSLFYAGNPNPCWVGVDDIVFLAIDSGWDVETWKTWLQHWSRKKTVILVHMNVKWNMNFISVYNSRYIYNGNFETQLVKNIHTAWLFCLVGTRRKKNVRCHPHFRTAINANQLKKDERITTWIVFICSITIIHYVCKTWLVLSWLLHFSSLLILERISWLTRIPMLNLNDYYFFANALLHSLFKWNQFPREVVFSFSLTAWYSNIPIFYVLSLSYFHQILTFYQARTSWL